MKKSQGKDGTAVRNIGQWPNGWTGNLEERFSVELKIIFQIFEKKFELFLGWKVNQIFE